MKYLMIWQRLFLLVLVIIIAALLPVVPAQAASYPLSTSDVRIMAALNFLLNSEAAHPTLWGGGEKTCYAIVAIDACGADPNDFLNSSGESMVDIIKSQVGQYLKPQASASLAHEYYILAIVAASENPWNFGGVNVAGQLLDMFDGTQIGQPGIINDDFWAIIALTAAGVKSSSSVIQTTKQFIIAHQNADGGWGCNTDGSGMGSGADPCDTANAIMALIAAGEKSSSTVIQNALSYLHSLQNSDGGFPYYEGTTASDVASDARVMAAIKACGGNPTGTEWTVDGNNPLSHALSLQKDDGGFAWMDGGSTDPWMTTYIMPALVGKYWPTRKTSDNAGPVINNISPVKDAVITESQPIISAAYTDAVSGVDISSISLKIGTINVTAQAQITETGLTYTPAEDLKDGKYRVQLTVTDRVGNKTTFTWNFTVDSGFSTDTTPPEIISISPGENETVTTQQPEIIVTYTDDLSGIDMDSIVLTVNGVDVTSAVNVETTQITYISTQEMPVGKVMVRLAVWDKTGNKTYHTWEFTIKITSNSDTPSDDEQDDGDSGNGTVTQTDNMDQSSSLNLAGKITGDGVITDTATLVSKDGMLTLVFDEGVVLLDDNSEPLSVITVEPCSPVPSLPGDLMPVGLTYIVSPNEVTITPSMTIKLLYEEQIVSSDQPTWDVNCDGKINVLDIAQMQTTVWSGKTPENFIIAGYDSDSGEWLCLASVLDKKYESIITTTGYMKYFTLVCPVSLATGTDVTIDDVDTNPVNEVDISSLETGNVIVQTPDTTKRLEIPQGTAIIGPDSQPIGSIVIASKEITPEPTIGYCRIGTACELGPDGITINSPVILTFIYEESSSQESLRWDTNGDGTVDFLDKDIVVAPEDFRIAYYDTTTSKWVFLESTIDRVSKTVTAEINHFTLFALMAPATEPLVVKEIAIDPDIVDIGKDITITVTVKNPGDHKGTYVIPLLIDGVLEDSQEVTLALGEHEITFNHQEPYSGPHEVTVLGVTGGFTVNAAAAQQGNWWDSSDVVFYLYIIIGLLCVIVIAGIIVLARILRKRNR